MAIGQYDYTCQECNHKFSLQLHSFEVYDVEAKPCFNCDGLFVKRDAVVVSENDNAKPSIGYFAQTVKAPQDFIDLLKHIKKNSPGSTMNDSGYIGGK